MEGSENMQGIVVRIDDGIGRAILNESLPEELRIAPSLRGVDLADAGTVILISVGTTANLVTLILARKHIASFAVRLTTLFRRTQRSDIAGHLVVSLQSPAGDMSINLELDDASGLAEALRALAEVAQTTSSSPIRPHD